MSRFNFFPNSSIDLSSSVGLCMASPLITDSFSYKWLFYYTVISLGIWKSNLEWLILFSAIFTGNSQCALDSYNSQCQSNAKHSASLFSLLFLISFFFNSLSFQCLLILSLNYWVQKLVLIIHNIFPVFYPLPVKEVSLNCHWIMMSTQLEKVTEKLCTA